MFKKKKIYSIEQHVKEILVEKLGNIKMNPDSILVDDLNADSLDQIEILMAIEDEFDLYIPEEDFLRIKKVKNVIKYIESKI